MHLVDNLSLKSGLKISRPEMDEGFYPVLPSKYITLHTEDHPSKQWDHLQACIDILYPILKKNGIEIIELGYNKETFHKVLSLKNIASLNQNAYIIKRSLLHLGTEGLFSQVASSYRRPLVCLFSNTSPDYCAPRWGDPKKEILIEPTRLGKKPSYAAQENPKTINTIFAETVASRVLDLLSISHDLHVYEPLYCGHGSHLPCLEVVPDFEPNPQFFPRTLLNLRLDYHFDEAVLPYFASGRKVALVTDQPINLRSIQRIRPALEHLFYHVSPETDPSYIKTLKAHGIPLTLLGDASHDLNKTRFHFLDWDVEEVEAVSKKNLDKDLEICENTYFSSSKSLFSEGIEYPCKLFWKKKIKKEKYNKIIDDPEFWDELNHYKLYRKTSNGKARQTTKK